MARPLLQPHLPQPPVRLASPPGAYGLRTGLTPPLKRPLSPTREYFPDISPPTMDVLRESSPLHRGETIPQLARERNEVLLTLASAAKTQRDLVTKLGQDLTSFARNETLEELKLTNTEQRLGIKRLQAIDTKIRYRQQIRLP